MESRRVCTLLRRLSTLGGVTAIPVEKRPSSPYGTHICRIVEFMPQPAELPPLFLPQREGSREHAFALQRLTCEVVSGWLVVRSLHIKEIGYGQQ